MDDTCGPEEPFRLPRRLRKHVHVCAVEQSPRTLCMTLSHLEARTNIQMHEAAIAGVPLTRLSLSGASQAEASRAGLPDIIVRVLPLYRRIRLTTMLSCRPGHGDIAMQTCKNGEGLIECRHHWFARGTGRRAREGFIGGGMFYCHNAR
jgi:hypothetical protein